MDNNTKTTRVSVFEHLNYFIDNGSSYLSEPIPRDNDKLTGWLILRNAYYFDRNGKKVRLGLIPLGSILSWENRTDNSVNDVYVWNTVDMCHEIEEQDYRHFGS